MNEEYIEGVCPKCKGTDLDYYESCVDENVFFYKCSCNDCDTCFHTVYSLKYEGLTDIIDGGD